MITVLSGQNSYMLQQELQRRIDAFVNLYGDFGLEKIDGEEAEFDRMREALQSQPFLVDKKLVVLRQPGSNKQFQEAFEVLLPTISDQTDVIIIEPKPDKRTAYFKALKKHTALNDYGELDAPQAASWLVDEAKQRGGSLSRQDAMYLVERVGLHQHMLANELAKLLDYAPHITRATIELLTDMSPHSTTFEMIDAALAGDGKRALALYEEQRNQKVEPQAIVGLLAWQLHVLAILTAAGQRDANAIASEAKLNPYVVRKNLSLARKLGKKGAARLVERLLEIDIASKTTSIDLDEALKAYILVDLGA